MAKYTGSNDEYGSLLSILSFKKYVLSLTAVLLNYKAGEYNYRALEHCPLHTKLVPSADPLHVEHKISKSCTDIPLYTGYLVP